MLYAWYPRPTGGAAIADVVLGGREPVGRLPVSLPRTSGVLPTAYNERHEHTERYVDGPATAEFPFDPVSASPPGPWAHRPHRTRDWARRCGPR